MEKFDYLILSEDDEWLSTGRGKTQEELEQDIEEIKKKQFDRWGEKTGIVIYKAPIMESYTLL